MNSEFFLGLVYNASLLLAMVLVFDLLMSRLKKKKLIIWEILAGMVLGTIGLAVMSTNWKLLPGVVFDTRSVLLGVTGLFFGWVPTLISLVMTAIYRVFQGGGGTTMGVSVIVASCLLGLGWRAIRKNKLHDLSWLEIYVFGVVVHVVMLLCTFFLPIEIRASVQKSIWLPVMTIYPVATLLLGTLMAGRLKRDLVADELTESENIFHSLFDSMVEGVALHEMVVDKNGKPINYRLLDVNHSYGVQTGISEDVRNRLATEVYKTAEAPYLSEFSEVVKTRKTKVMEVTFEPLSKTFKLAVFPIKENQFATVFEDITQRKTMVEALKNSEEKFENVFKNSPQIITISTLRDGIFLDVNEAFSEVIGYKRNEVLGKPVASFGIWANIKDREEMIKELKEKKILRNREFKFRTKNGQVITCLCSMAILDIGIDKYLLVLAVNIEDRKKAEQELARVNAQILTEKQNFESILREMGDAVLVTDANRKTILTNKAMEKLSGFSEEEVVRKEAWDLMDWKYESTGLKPMEMIGMVFEKRKSAKPHEAVRLKAKDNSLALIDGVGTPILNSKKELVGTVWVMRDVTKERELEKMRLDFISLASHQLRTPLTGIKWFVELLEGNVTKMPIEKTKEYVGKIGESTERMIALVNDLLTTSRAEENRLEKETGKYSLREILQQAIDGQGTLFLDKGIEIEGLDKIPEVEMEADMIQMVQVFGNLLNNAATYSQENSRVVIGGKTEGEEVEVSVRDFGVGIPKDQQKRVFEKFYRGDNVKKTIPGSGLGLYVAKSMVESHGGKMSFVSTENEGTTFFVKLPIKQNNGKKEGPNRGG